MQEQRSFTIQSLLVILVVNIIMLGTLYYFFVQGSGIPVNMDPTLFYWLIGIVLTLILWTAIWMVGRKAIGDAAITAAADAAAEFRARQTVAKKSKPAPKPEPKPEPKPAEFVVAPETAAIQMLSILQRKGRLIDFLQEDLSAFDDAQIGAAVRNIHDGSRKALAEHVELAPVYDQPEGSQITVESGFDAYAVRLSGNVAGDPPFTGTLRHRGWRVASINLPEQAKDQTGSKVVAAAEVEV